MKVRRIEPLRPEILLFFPLILSGIRYPPSFWPLTVDCVINNAGDVTNTQIYEATKQRA